MNSLLQKGFSIIELMIALLLGSILLLGVTQMLVSSSAVGTTSNNLSVNQDRAKTVLDLLGSEAGRAGYKGCERGGTLELSGGLKVYAFEPITIPSFGIRFSYGVDKDVANNIGAELHLSRDCFGRKLHYRSMAYRNCDEGLCIEGSSQTPHTEDLVDDSIEDVTIDKIVLTLKNDVGQFSEVTIDTNSSFTEDQIKDLQKAQLVTFYITVYTAAGDSADKLTAETTVKREYSATFRLRNL